MYTVLMIALALLLVGLNGFFVAAEFAFVKVRKTQLELLAERGSKRAKSAIFGVTHLDAYLSVCQLGITLASLGLGWIGEPAVAHALLPALGLAGITNPAVLTSVSVAVGFSIIILLHVVFGELCPKSLSIQKAEATVLLLARPMYFFYVVCLPLVLVMNGISNFFLRLAGVGPAGENEQSHSPEELRMLIVDSSEGGRLDKEEGRMLDNIFSFYQKTARDIMLHRNDVIAFDVEMARKEALAQAGASGHTRFPAYEKNRDDIIGFVHIRDVQRCEDCQNLAPVVRNPIYAHETMRLDKLLRHMQRKRLHFCIVIDEYGIWQGIVTMEDILEAIVGDIQDEFDNEEPDVVKQPDGSFIISGDLSLDDIAEFMPLTCKRKDLDLYKIIAAYFIKYLDRIPEEGDTMELCDKLFTVIAMDKKRVRRVKVEHMPKDGPDANF